MKDHFHIQWHITNLCNFRCKHCYQEDFSDKNDLDSSALRRVANHLLQGVEAWGKAACIHLTGGEPLLKPELVPLLEFLDQKPVVEELGIITSGLPVNQQVLNRLGRVSKLMKVKISLDGPDEETHGATRRKGTFEKVLQRISLIKEAGRFETILMFTLTKRNAHSLSSLLDLCQELGIDGLILERFIPLGQGRQMREDALDKKAWKEFVEELLRFFFIQMEEADFSAYQAFQIRFSQGEMELMGAPCVLGTDGLCIMPEGEVFPCRRFPISIGNLLDTPLDQLWESSELLRRLRRKENLKGKCKNCDCKECRGCRSLALSLTGDYLEEDPLCWYLQQ